MDKLLREPASACFGGYSAYASTFDSRKRPDGPGCRGPEFLRRPSLPSSGGFTWTYWGWNPVVHERASSVEMISPRPSSLRRTVGLHALRHTFRAHQSKNGMRPCTAQAAMGHSSLDLTMKVYTDLSLLDGAGAVEALPELGLEGKAESSVASHRGRRRAS